MDREVIGTPEKVDLNGSTSSLLGGRTILVCHAFVLLGTEQGGLLALVGSTLF